MIAVVAHAFGATPSIDAPPISGDAHPADVAVVIGNEDYLYFPDVPYAGRDADAFAAWLLHTRGVPASRVRRLDGASHIRIGEAVKSAAKDVQPGGTLWVYYAGHGLGLVPEGSDTPQRVLLGANAEVEAAAFPAYTVRLDTLVDAASQSAARDAVFVIDACFNNAGRDGASLTGTRMAVPLQALKSAPKVTIWAATAPSEVASALPATKHGAFTYFAVGGLSGWADADHDGQVTLAEAEAWTTSGLRVAGVAETPSLIGEAAFIAASGRLAPTPGGPIGAVDRDPTALALHGLLLDFAIDGVHGDGTDAYRDACNLGYVPACRASSWHHADGAVFAEAVRVFRPLCSSKDPLACLVSAWDDAGIARTGGLVDVGAASLQKAKSTLQKTCDGGYVRACGELGYIYLRESRDGARALPLTRRACDGGSFNACTTLGQIYENGWGTMPDPARAGALYAQACDGGDLDGCDLVLRGEKDEAKRQAGLQSLCDQGLLLTCRGLAMAGQKSNAEKSRALLAEICGRGDSDSCKEIGVWYEHGDGAPKDVALARRYYETACGLGNVGGCGQLGNLLLWNDQTARDPKRGLELLSRACDEGRSKSGCALVGRAYSEPAPGVSKDVKTAATWYAKACALGDAASCSK
jgi:TPR repeat protein/uncharacterized caspase-like protein